MYKFLITIPLILTSLNAYAKNWECFSIDMADLCIDSSNLQEKEISLNNIISKRVNKHREKYGKPNTNADLSSVWNMTLKEIRKNSSCDLSRGVNKENPLKMSTVKVSGRNITVIEKPMNEVLKGMSGMLFETLDGMQQGMQNAINNNETELLANIFSEEGAQNLTTSEKQRIADGVKHSYENLGGKKTPQELHIEMEESLRAAPVVGRELQISTEKKNNFHKKHYQDIVDIITFSKQVDQYVFDGKRKAYFVNNSEVVPHTDNLGNLYISQKWYDSKYRESILLHEAAHYCKQDYIFPELLMEHVALPVFKLTMPDHVQSMMDMSLDTSSGVEHTRVNTEISVDRFLVGLFKENDEFINEYISMLSSLEKKGSHISKRKKLTMFLVEMYDKNPQIKPDKFESLLSGLYSHNDIKGDAKKYADKYNSLKEHLLNNI